MTRRAVFAMVVALALAPAAAAKFELVLTLSDPRPRVSERVTVTIETAPAQPADMNLRLIAIAPGVGMYSVLGKATRERPFIARRNGFFVQLVPEGMAREATTWRGTVRFPRPGRWLLVVPNWGALGYALPPPVVRAVQVRR